MVVLAKSLFCMVYKFQFWHPFVETTKNIPAQNGFIKKNFMYMYIPTPTYLLYDHSKSLDLKILVPLCI